MFFSRRSLVRRLHHPVTRAIRCGWLVVLAAASALSTTVATGQTQASGSAQVPAETTQAGGPVRLRQPGAAPGGATAAAERQRRQDDRPQQEAPYRPGEFELFVRRITGEVDDSKAIRRFGSELMADGGQGSSASEQLSRIPPDHPIGPGDEIQISIWGSVDADLNLTVDRTGRITLPRVGVIPVLGLKAADLQGAVTQRVGQVFKNFELSATVSKVRDIRVYVTGFLQRPGTYTVSGLSTMTGAVLRAGGPSAAGSFRNIELRRDGARVAEFDLYQLILNGARVGDLPLQTGDVVHVNAVGPQVAIIGSINRPGIFELKSGETINHVLAMAGGFSPVADRTRVAIERLESRPDVRINSLELPNALTIPPVDGDVLRVFSLVDATLPVARQNKRVRIEGEVIKPGEYILPPNSTIDDLLRTAGGTTGDAFVFGSEFYRESARRTQVENYERALRDLETEFARVMASRRVISSEESQAQNSSSGAANRLIDRLRQVRPTGRIILQLEPASSAPPPLALEDGDRLYIPAKPTSVGVFGSVYNAGNYLFSNSRSIGGYLRLAGGATRNADNDGVFVIRANGNVISSRQDASWWRGRTIDDMGAEPGDTIFVPELLDQVTFTQAAKEWTQILYQFGIGAAALKTLRGN
jgi:protein involved in polysaccharide export with SLBB domain